MQTCKLYYKKIPGQTRDCIYKLLKINGTTNVNDHTPSRKKKMAFYNAIRSGLKTGRETYL